MHQSDPSNAWFYTENHARHDQFTSRSQRLADTVEVTEIVGPLKLVKSLPVVVVVEEDFGLSNKM
jgi:hypothetical protein